ncbi:ABC transporter permease [Ruicaihuangia caeni]|uniref:ABC transporter permease n=1 Tax=Ruicaihuangia caeni TaxID=3042517 RepID=UPI00338F38D8
MSAVTSTRSRTKTGGIVRNAGINYGLLIALLVAWQIVTMAAPSPFFPTPLTIAERFWAMFMVAPTGEVLLTQPVTQDLIPTVVRMLLGFLVGSFVGVLMGVWSGMSRVFRGLTNWIVEFVRAIPATATLPLFILLVGGTDGMKVAFIAYGITWYVMLNTAQGVRAIEPTMLLMGRAYRKTRSQQMLTIVLPATLPHIFTSLRLATAGSIILAIASEFLASTNGIGYQLQIQTALFNMPAMWSWMVFLALFGLMVNVLLELLERKLLAWHRMSH